MAHVAEAGTERHDKWRYAPLKKYVSDIAGLRSEIAAIRSTLAAHERTLQRLQQSGTSAANVSGAHRYGREARADPPASVSGGSKWQTHLVLVVATLDGRLKPEDAHWARNTSNTTVILYQRVDPSAPHYSPNLAFEAGVHVQFVLEHYDDLPNQTLFLQDGPAAHNPKWLQWAACLRKDAAYAPFVLRREMRKGLSEWDLCCNADALVEQCFRDTLAVFNLSKLLPPRQQPTVGYYPGEMYMASAAQLRRHPRSAYARMHAMAAGGDGRCHHGPLEWSALNTTRRTETLAYDSRGMSKHTSGGAWEHLQHVIVGGMGRPQPADIARGEGLFAPFSFNFCLAFEPHCDASPCDIFRRTPMGRRELLRKGMSALLDEPLLAERRRPGVGRSGAKRQRRIHAGKG